MAVNKIARQRRQGRQPTLRALRMAALALAIGAPWAHGLTTQAWAQPSNPLMPANPPSHPQPSPAKGSALQGADPTEAPTTFWYDGRRSRPLWRDRERQAEFPLPQGDTTPGNRPNPNLGDKSNRPEHARLKAISDTPKNNVLRSPVFLDNPGAGGAPRALPGGILIEFKAPLDAATARMQLRAEGLVPVRPVVGERIWLVASAPGLPCLELANRLHESGRYASVQPNWWQPRGMK